MQESFVDIKYNNSKIHIHYIEEKPNDSDRLMVLIHGFPQNSYVWSSYLTEFTQMGYHVVAPDLRGYNKSSKPKEKSAYEIKNIMNDVLELIKHCGYDKAVIVGHDWGGSVVWELAEHYADFVSAAIVLNSPHRGAYAANIRRNPLLNLRQTFRSWYIYLFQLPFLPEFAMKCCDFKWLKHNFCSWARTKDAFSNEEIEVYKKALREPYALTSAINYYRANTFGDFGLGVIKASMGKKIFEKISVPSLLLWGKNDLPLDIELTKNMEEFFSGIFKKVYFEDTSHWILHERHKHVVEEIKTFLNDISK
ncbi:alpha/beta fold hydrolase [Sulfurovum sp. TSL1]|uniref:alpha/beta fold hydrolase n=1 Tax=Sulfurovum sp. TSL1 TaxID=2826994 RepID=UPI001CC7E917|nr:alpha/beta hydrolase [Sulfurovum sp. TSL1]GIT99047.1 epoxide hydrolase [Sulfurovum sp. TSL1]